MPEQNAWRGAKLARDISDPGRELSRPPTPRTLDLT